MISPTWQDFLVSRMLGARSEQKDGMWRNALVNFWKKYSGIVVGILLIVVGSLMLGFWRQNIARDFGTAILISGVLTVTVDPYIKGRTKRETALDIFHHMLGFKLPEKIQERLKHIVETTEWYRTDNKIRCVVSESGDDVLFNIEQEFRIRNATQYTLCFEPAMDFEMTEYPSLDRVICLDDPQYGQDAVLTPDPKEPKALAYKGKPIRIAPDGVCGLKYEYRVQRPFRSGVFSLYFKYPTIGLSLTVKSSDKLRITASQENFVCSGEWRYDKLFMPGDHIDIRWERTA